MIGVYNYTVVATYIGFSCAICGIRFAYCDDIFGAVICLLAAGFCDAFDGKIARTKKDRNDLEKKFGIQIDSLSDVVCFGVLPGMIGCSLCRDNRLYGGVMIFYVLAALIRLAYFNVTEDERQAQTDEVRKTYLGLPVTASAVLVPMTFCFMPLLGSEFETAFGLAMAITGILFITPMKVPKPGKKLMPVLVAIGCCIAVVLITEYCLGLLDWEALRG